MTVTNLLETLKEFTEYAVKDLLLPVQPYYEDLEYFKSCPREGATPDTEEDTEEEPEPEEMQELRPAAVYIPVLPELLSYQQKAPFITHEYVVGSTRLDETRRNVQSVAQVRTCFCVYNENRQEGTLALYGLMERLKQALLDAEIIGKQFKLDMEKGADTMVYPPNPNQTAIQPFCLGEMFTTWILPPVERKMRYVKEGYSNIRQPGPGPRCDELCGGRFPGGIDPAPESRRIPTGC